MVLIETRAPIVWLDMQTYMGELESSLMVVIVTKIVANFCWGFCLFNKGDSCLKKIECTILQFSIQSVQYQRKMRAFGRK